jgi:hypothetical protein
MELPRNISFERMSNGMPLLPLNGDQPSAKPSEYAEMSLEQLVTQYSELLTKIEYAYHHRPYSHVAPSPFEQREKVGPPP